MQPLARCLGSTCPRENFAGQEGHSALWTKRWQHSAVCWGLRLDITAASSVPRSEPRCSPLRDCILDTVLLRPALVLGTASKAPALANKAPDIRSKNNASDNS